MHRIDRVETAAQLPSRSQIASVAFARFKV